MRGISLSRELSSQQNSSFSKMSNSTSGMTLLVLNCADQIDPAVCARKEALGTFSKLATMDPPGGIMLQSHCKKRFGALVHLSDRWNNFCTDQFAKVMLKYGSHSSSSSTGITPRTSGQERISKKRTKNEAKTTKPDTEWKSVEKTKSRQSP
ncbi:hypothetical protein Tco_0468307, partial [Tanacetum coccineum]